jgi:hypothetical protein
MVLDSVDASAASCDGGLAEDAWATPGPGTGQRQAGLYMLHRTVGQLCAHELGAAGAPPPPPWGPFALLAALCAGLARPQPRDGAGALLNAAAAATTPGAAPALVRVAEEGSDGACARAPSAACRGHRCARARTRCTKPDDHSPTPATHWARYAGEDDWERVDDLLLPPPPSSADDELALWERYAR